MIMKQNMIQKQTAMKKRLLSALFVMAMLCRLQAQNAETHVTVHAGETALETLLTEEQKQSVTHLTVTGTLLDEDYAFLRNELLNQLETLNLKDAEIDTIPAHAFEDFKYLGTDSIRIILPSCLKHVKDKAFCCNNPICVFELTGKYPTLGQDIFTKDLIYAEPRMEVSPDNEYCTMIEDAIYSSDHTTLHYPNYNCTEPTNGGQIIEGTKVISANAYENRAWDYKWTFTIPASVDSIGDRAFASFQIITPDMPIDSKYFRMICKSSIPPCLGQNVFYTMENPYWGMFYVNEASLYVPDESVDIYKTTKCWNRFRKIKGLSEYHPVSVNLVSLSPSLSVKDVSGCYILSSSIAIKEVRLYSLSGLLLFSTTVHAQQVRINKSILTPPYAIASVDFANGTTQIVKLT